MSDGINIANLYAYNLHFQTTNFGNVFFRHLSNSSQLNVLSSWIAAANSQYSSFVATTGFLITYDSVERNLAPGQPSTFQIILLTNRRRSFIMYNYGIVATDSATIGYTDPYNSINTNTFSSNGTNFDGATNVNITGKYIFQVNQDSNNINFIIFFRIEFIYNLFL